MLRTWPLLLISLLVGALALACGDDADEPSTATPSPDLAPTPMTFPERPEITIDPDKKYFANVETTKGTIRIRLRPDIAVQTVNSLIFLAREGYFDGVTFHRVIRDVAGEPDFMAQGGDPTGTGSGDPGYNLPDEFSPDVPFERGTVAMANTGLPDSSGSQFFITYNDQYQAALNGRYTVFGKVTEGMKVVDSLTPRNPATDPGAPPGDAIITITIEEGD
jgi:peptidylprolyl isomerase